jgi:hypothetical protein
MISTQEKIIDGHSVMVTQYPGRRAVEYKARLFKLIGPSFARTLAGAEGFSFDALVPAFDAFTESLEPKTFVNFLIELFCSTRIDGKEITDQVFDDVFAGDMMLLYQVLWYTLEVNYKSFFDKAGIGKVLSRIKTPPPAVKTQVESKGQSKR